MTCLAAALSSRLAARLYSFCNSSTVPSAAAVVRLICVLSVLMMARLCTRRFSALRRFFLALRVCGIDPLQSHLADGNEETAIIRAATKPASLGEPGA